MATKFSSFFAFSHLPTSFLDVFRPSSFTREFCLNFTLQQHSHQRGLKSILRNFSRNPAVQKQAHHDKMSNVFSRSSLKRSRPLQPQVQVHVVAFYVSPEKSYNFLDKRCLFPFSNRGRVLSDTLEFRNKTGYSLQLPY